MTCSLSFHLNKNLLDVYSHRVLHCSFRMVDCIKSMGHEFEQTPGDGRRQRSPPWGPKELDREQLNNNNIKICFIKKSSKIHHATLLFRKRLGIKLETNLPFIFPGNQELWVQNVFVLLPMAGGLGIV